jgi:hypothetical protein
MATPVPADYMTSRTALHTVAEHVLAPALHRATGRIGLRVTPGGFGTPPYMADGVEHQVRITGTDLVVRTGVDERRTPLVSVGQAAAFVGIEPGGPASVYALATRLEPDVPLALEPAAVAVVHGWFQTAGTALEALRAEHPGLEPTIAQLWPEHFDLAVTMAEVNYGGSPGDADHGGPYAYVGPWQPERYRGEFWNEPFGASRSHVEVPTPEELHAFFETGCRLSSATRRP